MEPANIQTTPTDPPLSLEELQLAARNRGIPLEALRYDITPSGLHYLLIHFDIPAIDPAAWRLSVGGNVERTLDLSLEDLRAREVVTHAVTLECAGNGRALLSPRPISQPWLNEAVSTARWTGTPLAGVLEEAGVRDGSVHLVFSGADAGIQGDVPQEYQRALTVDDAMGPAVLLAWEMNDRPLEPQHGAPVRLVVPGWYGMTSVKWLTRIDAVTAPFEGYQQVVSYRYQRDEDDAGEPVTKIRPRALMIPPGEPDFLTRRRFLSPGRVLLRGRAWSGLAPITRVEVGIDGRWAEATLAVAVGEFAWRGWSFDWHATAGEHELSCRATDAAGNAQPTDQFWNVGGFGNTVAQRIAVTVA